MLKFIIGAVAGGLFGYFVLYKLIGCSSGSCPITANPYISTVYGLIIGVLLAASVSVKPAVPAETSQPAAIQYVKISPIEAKARIDSGDELIILDVRTQEEFNAGHIPGAILIPNETILSDKPELLPDLDAEILVYCRSGNRSAQAARKLIDMGYTKVYDFGGIIDWPYEIVTEP